MKTDKQYVLIFRDYTGREIFRLSFEDMKNVTDLKGGLFEFNTGKAQTGEIQAIKTYKETNVEKVKRFFGL